MAGLLTLPAAQEAAISAALTSWASEPFDELRANCGLSVLDYVETVRGRVLDPSPRSLGRLGIASVVRSPGGFEQYVRGVMERLACPVADVPRRGDIGLVERETGLTVCLCVGSKWAFRGPGAVVIELAEPVIAWRVSCPLR